MNGMSSELDTTQSHPPISNLHCSQSLRPFPAGLLHSPQRKCAIQRPRYIPAAATEVLGEPTALLLVECSEILADCRQRGCSHSHAVCELVAAEPPPLTEKDLWYMQKDQNPTLFEKHGDELPFVAKTERILVPNTKKGHCLCHFCPERHEITADPRFEATRASLRADATKSDASDDGDEGEDDGKVSVAHYGVMTLRDACKKCLDFFFLTNRCDLDLQTPEQQISRKLRDIVKTKKKKMKKAAPALKETPLKDIKVPDGYLQLEKAQVKKMNDDCNGICSACGINFVLNKARNGGNLVGSIERISSLVAYVQGNCMLLCQTCNAAKSDATPASLILLCARIAAKHGYVDGMHEDGMCEEDADMNERRGRLFPTEEVHTAAGPYNQSNTEQKGKGALKREEYYDLTWGSWAPVETLRTLDASTIIEDECACFWCGRIVSSGCMSPDRAYPELAYTHPLQRILLACSDCNSLRGKLSVGEFVEWCCDIVMHAMAYCQTIVETLASFVPTEFTASLPPLSTSTTDALHPKSKDDCNGATFMRQLVNAAYEIELSGGKTTAKALRIRLGLKSDNHGTKLVQAALRPGRWNRVFFGKYDDYVTAEDVKRRMAHGVPKCFRTWWVKKAVVAKKKAVVAKKVVDEDEDIRPDKKVKNIVI